MIHILLIDDSNCEKSTLSKMLDLETDFQIIKRVRDEDQALEYLELSAENNLDIVIINVAEAHLNGFTLAKILHQRFPNCRVILLSDLNDRHSIKSTIEAGVKGYLPKNASKREIIDTVRRVAQGYLQIAPSLCDRVIPNLTTERTYVLEQIALVEEKYNHKFAVLEQKIRLINHKNQDLLYGEITAQTDELKLELRQRLDSLQEQINEQVKNRLDALSNHFNNGGLDAQKAKNYKFSLFKTQINSNRLLIRKLETQLIWLSYSLVCLGLIYLGEKIVAFMAS